MVNRRPERPKNELQAHYTSSPEIVRYMVSKLRPRDEDSVWEPCAGRGDLIDGVLAEAPNADIRASDISETATTALKNKYSELRNVEVRREDALEVVNCSLFEGHVQFTRILANPPYGAYLTPDRRTLLKKRYPRLYVKETYGLILYHSLSLVKEHGRLVFIVPDTFLWLHRHEFLRRALLTETTVEEIALFPSKFFPGVRFGYSGLCIVTLARATPAEDHRIQLVENLREPAVLLDCAAGRYPLSRCSIMQVSQKEIAQRPHAELVRAPSENGLSANGRHQLCLGEVAEVRTGFYSGNDRRWVRRAHAAVTRAKPYRDVDVALISRLKHPPLAGIDDAPCFIPLLRGGVARFLRPTLWYVDWSVNAVTEYTRAGKNPARFQNAQFYFREGIGVPMVASTRLTAALLEQRLFDQGIVGIFPKDDVQLLYWLGFLNTKLATELLREINPTANNSANYLKRLPVVLPQAGELAECDRLVTTAIEEARALSETRQATLEELESLYRSIWDRARTGEGRITSRY